MSGQATGWVLRHGPCTTWAAQQGIKKDRAGQSVLTAIADAANRDGENSHPGMAAMIDASGYARSTVIEALGRLELGGYVEITEQGGGRGNATVYKIPGVSDASWRPGERVQIPDGADDGKGPDQPAKGSSSAAETVQISPDAPLTATSSNGSNNPRPAPGSAAELEEAFECFYAVYPRKVGKGDARKAWPVAVKTAAFPQKIIDGAARYAEEVRGKDQNYVKHPGPWLRAERWLDEPGANRTANGSNGSGPRRHEIDTDRSGVSGDLEL